MQRERQRDLCLFGTALLTKRGVVTDVGYLDVDFYAYWEDTDYSVRTIRAGYRNVVATNATIPHKTPFVGKEEVIVSPYYFYYMVRNEYRFWMKHLQFPKTLRFLRR